jgi:hypothetical protein
MGTVMFVSGDKEPIFIKESYLTIKKRVFDINGFIEISLKGGSKICVNKSGIASFGPEAEKKKK